MINLKSLKDTLAADYKAVAALLDRRDRGFKKYQTMEKASQIFTEWLNTDEAAEILASGDFYFNDLYNIKNFPKEEMLSQIHWWKKRNEGMCKNIVDRANGIHANRVVVMVEPTIENLCKKYSKQCPMLKF